MRSTSFWFDPYLGPGQRYESIFKRKQHPLWGCCLGFVLVLWRLPTLPGLIQVSSAVPGLTSLFGMGRGEHQANSHQQGLCWFVWYGEGGEANRRTGRSNSHQQAL